MATQSVANQGLEIVKNCSSGQFFFFVWEGENGIDREDKEFREFKEFREEYHYFFPYKTNIPKFPNLIKFSKFTNQPPPSAHRFLVRRG